METGFLNQLLCVLCVAALTRSVPGPLGTGTPGNSSTFPADGFTYSAATDELRNFENNATSTSSSSESLSPSQRKVLLTHSGHTHDADVATEPTQAFTETSSRNHEAISLSIEPLTTESINSSISISSISSSINSSISSSSSISISSISSSSSSSSISISSISSSSSIPEDWTGFTNTHQTQSYSHSVSQMFTDEASLPQDSADTTLSLSSQTSALTDAAYTTTISRAGERTLLSVTNSTSSAFPEESSSHQPPFTGPIPPRPVDTVVYTYTNTDVITEETQTDHHVSSSETGSSADPRATHNTAQHQHTPPSENTTPSVTESSTEPSVAPVSSTPVSTPPLGSPANVSQTDQASGSGVSTESSNRNHSSSTMTVDTSSQIRQKSWGAALTVAPSTVSSSTTGFSDAVTDVAVMDTEVFLTSVSVTVTDGSHLPEEDTDKATTFTPTTPPSSTTALSTSVTSSSTSSSISTSSSTQRLQTEPTLLSIAPSTSTPTLTPQTSATSPTLYLTPSQTQETFTGTPAPTHVSTLHAATSTQTEKATKVHRQYVTTSSSSFSSSSSSSSYTHSSPPTRSTQWEHTSSKQTHSGVMEQVVTTPTTTVIQPTRAPPPPRNPCVSNPCMNGGMCVSYKKHQFVCHCQQAWTGPTCSQDVNECEQDPCPLGSICVNTQGSFSCECPLGFDLEDGRTCSRAKTFLGTFSVNRQPHEPASFKSAAMHEIQREILQLLNVSLSVIQGYSRSTLSQREGKGVNILAVNMFSISTDVTTAEVFNSIQMSLGNCSSSLSHCRVVLHHQLTYHKESLCVAQKTQCDTERSSCSDSSGTASCQCQPGYYKHNPDDLSCLECGDGYKLENGTCVPCMFGFGGFNCGNFYKLIAVVVAPAGGALLLVLIIALIVTCCRKDKNDLNKIIFKSGDLQMSPYADFQKNNRISMEWGRDTIEMQENGSTKNLLQMTDIYYSPALRNSDLERNGLYPFTGLPGSRHSCIYPAQWNPSFISDDSRRRDYF